jgi:hypothetical protein
MQMANKTSLIVVTWDGKSAPLSHIHKNELAQFEVVLYDYSGQVTQIEAGDFKPVHFISKKSECKGDVIEAIYEYVKTLDSSKYNYIGLLDDDIFLTYADINKLLFIAQLEKLDVFQPSLTLDSYYHHRQFVHKAGHQIQDTHWVEIMAPFYSLEVFMAAGPYFQLSISGTGTDVYLIPTIQKLIGKTKTCVVHAVQMKHCRPIRTDFRIFSNGKDNLQEIKELQVFCKKMASENPTIFDQAFIKNVLDRTYVHAIPLKYKLKRIKPMLKNLYSLIVDASYR